MNPPSPRIRCLHAADNPVPKLGHAHLPQVGDLFAELSGETRGRDRVATATEADLLNAADTIVRYRLGSLAVIRQIDRGARRMFLPDLSELGRRPFPEILLTMHLLSHPPPSDRDIAT